MKEFVALVGGNTLWAIFMTAVTAVSVVLNLWVSSKFARKEDLSTVSNEVRKLHSEIKAFPSVAELHETRIEIEGLRGDLKAMRAETKQVKHLVELLVEQQIKRD